MLIKKVSSIFSLVTLFFASLPCITAQIDYSSLPIIDYSRPRDYIIREVTVSGINFLDPVVVRSVSGLEPGKTIAIPGDDITQAIEKLWGQGLFSDVKITTTKIEGNEVYLEIFLQEPPRLSVLNIEGLRRSELKDIEEKIKLRPGSLITENTLNNTKDIILRFFLLKKVFSILPLIYERMMIPPFQTV